MLFLSLAGDVLWIIALSIMAGGSRVVWSRTEADVTIPLQFAQSGAPTWRVKRWIALILVPALALLVGVLLVVFNRNSAADPQNALIFFGVRATAAGLLGLVHFRWLGSVIQTLEREGALKPLQ